MTTAGPLKTHRVLVTRPAHQSAKLVTLLEAQGAEVLQQPAIEIKPYTSAEQAELIKQIEPGDWLIFISRNAVSYALSLIDINTLRQCQLAAVGSATHSALKQAGLQNISSPETGFTSEDLLLLSAFQTDNILARRVFIIRGGKGRDVLFKQLQQRGAKVCTLDVYQRQPAKKVITDQQILNCDVITISSQQGLESLLTMLNTDIQQQLKQKLLIVPGQRCRQAAIALGFGRVECAADATDNATVDAIIGTINR